MNRFVPLALIAPLPVSVNILLFHVYLEPSMPGLAVVAVLLALNLSMIWHHRASYGPLVRPRAVPNPHSADADGRVSAPSPTNA